MRLLFVNHPHPNTGLVGAVRLHRFAEALTRSGHQVLLLCSHHKGTPDTPDTLLQRMKAHDWAAPLVLSVRDASSARPRTSTNGFRNPLGRARTAIELTMHGGPFWRWRRAAALFMPAIRESLKPDLAYASFGNLDALAIARDYARQNEIPWVMDIKDPASAFIPKPLAPRLMRPFRDANAVTLNSEFQRNHNGHWADASAALIYSGVEAPPATSGDYDPAQVAMVGSIYSDVAADTLLRGFAAWRAGTQPDAALHYFGINAARLEAAAVRTGISGGLVIEGQVPRATLLSRCARMAALTYTSSPDRTFHHKFLELAVLGRPLVTSPNETTEAQALCVRFGISNTVAADATQVHRALVAAASTPTVAMAKLLEEMSWQQAATRLEQVFTDVLRRHRQVQ